MKRLVPAVVLFLLFSCDSTPVSHGMYHRTITIHPSMTGGTLHDHAVYIRHRAPELKSKEQGGHVARNDAGDIVFTSADGAVALPSKIALYDPSEGYLAAWVSVPVLSPDHGVTIVMWYGGGDSVSPADHSPFAGRYDVFLDDGDLHEGESMPSDISPAPFGELTVEAWVETDAYRPEALQPLVTKWRQSGSFDAFDAYNAGETDGLKTIGYFGAVFDGRYVYFSPQRHGHEVDSTHGHVLRYDTMKPFSVKTSWSAYDAGNTDGLETRGHYGAIFDGRYVYFVPRGKNYGGQTGSFNEFQSNLLRYDTHGGFKDPASWSAHDMGVDISKQSAAFDGRYIYFCPGYEKTDDGYTDSSLMIRYDTESPFRDESAYRSIDARDMVGPKAGNYDGAVFDGRYIYYVPLVSGVVLRYDTRGDYGDKTSWTTYDANALDMPMNVGAVFDGRYVYFAAYASGVIVRYDTSGPFGDDFSWTSHDAAGTGGLDTAGFDGAFYDGRYVYFAPFVSPRQEGGYNFHTNWLRFDTTLAFTDGTAWDAVNASNVNGLATVGYNGGAFDGRFIYLAPWQDRTDGRFGIHGNVLRYDTTGDDASFALLYDDVGHNGGLVAAAPGPGFIINTDKGVAGVHAHEPLLPGGHYLAGVYDGCMLRLYIDGGCVAERRASGTITANDVPVLLGEYPGGSAVFNGVFRFVRVSHRAMSPDALRATYMNVANPAGTLTVAAEQAVSGN